MTDRQQQHQTRREELKVLSRAVKHLVQEGEYENINAAVVDSYRKDGHEEFKTIRQWNKEGKRIKKGSKAFVVWGSPQKSKRANDEDQDEFSFFPLCYLFSNMQTA